MAQATRKTARTQAVQESVEQVWLAGLGALALTEEEGSKFFRSLVKKGEGVERRSRARLDEVLSAAKQAAKQAPRRAVTTIERRSDDIVASVMHRLGVPTQREIQGLTKRIEGLATTLERKPRVRSAAAASRTRKPAAETRVS